MLIRLKLHAIIADQVGDLHDVRVPAGTDVTGLLAALGVDRDRAGFVLVNGHRTPYRHRTQRGRHSVYYPIPGRRMITSHHGHQLPDPWD